MPQTSSRRLSAPRAAAGLAGVAALAGAVFSTEMALGHMAGMAAICGGSAPHCAWCYGAAALLLAGLTGLSVALRPARRAVRVAADRSGS